MISAGLCAGVSALVALWPGSDRWVWALLPWGAFLLSHFGPALTEAIPHSHRRWAGPGLQLLAWALFGAALTRIVVGVVAGPWDILSTFSQ
jgi:hypothetical protein